AGPVRVAVKDAAGNDVRQLTGRAEAGQVNRIAWDMRTDAPIRPAGAATAGAAGGWRGGRGGGAGRGAAPPAATGAAPAFAAPEAGGGGPGEPAAEGAGGGGGGGRGGFGGNRGTLVDPGSYTVALTLAGKTETKTVRVEDDPRLSVSQDDRTRRRTAITRLFTMTRQADEGRRKISP